MRVRAALNEATRGWTQTRLAAATGYSQGQISRWLTGARNASPNLDQIATIEDAIGKPRGFVLGAAGYATPAGAKEGAKHHDPLVRELGAVTNAAATLRVRKRGAKLGDG